jgi:very-short-patch-repair endonuclease
VTDDLRILPAAPLPPELERAEEQADEYRRLREDITHRGQSKPLPLRDALQGVGEKELLQTVDPRSRRQQRYSSDEKRAYASYLRDHMTPAEWKLWAELQTWADIVFQAQAIVNGWVVDFYCPPLKLVIEVDGGVHDNNAQWQRDQHRDTMLTRDGYTVLRIKNESILRNVQRVTSKILDTIAGIEAHDAS